MTSSQLRDQRIQRLAERRLPKILRSETDDVGANVADGLIESLQQLCEASVGFSFLKERFSTWVRHDRHAPKVEVGLLRGPFHHLKNRWEFFPHPEGTRVEFFIDFAFKSRVLDMMLQANFDRAVGALMRCFEARAAHLYGRKA